MPIYEITGQRAVRAGRNSTFERVFTIPGVTTSLSAMDLLLTELAAIPAVIVDGWTLDQVNPVIEELDEAIWAGRLEYAHRGGTQPDHSTEDLAEPGDSEFSFDFSPEQTKILYSRNQTKFGDDAPDMGGAINVDQNGVPQGTDIIVPHGVYTETKVFDSATVTQAWVAARGKMVGTVSNATFKGFSAGELLLQQFGGRKRGSGDWSITCAWGISENESNITVAGIEGVNKPGWDYLWVKYEQDKDTTKNRLVPKAIGVYVDEVYRRADHNTLGF
jgi:hypothetical protein